MSSSITAPVDVQDHSFSLRSVRRLLPALILPACPQPVFVSCPLLFVLLMQMAMKSGLRLSFDDSLSTVISELAMTAWRRSLLQVGERVWSAEVQMSFLMSAGEA
ncbi:MAG: hypothetical protein REI12_00535 [Pedobacter sp.]|nr:hypothetical protein [Pedobacter sp.]